jgi:signal transduction histidine kinase
MQRVPGVAHRLTLRVRVADAHTLQVAVDDNGEGIAAEHLTRIFAHGFTTKKDGHGFGLHSCVLAAREMGGTLRASSAGPGHGATFTLELPLQAATELPADAPSHPVPTETT